MAMARLIFFSALCVAFSRRQMEEAIPMSLVEDVSNTANIVFMDELDDVDEEMITSVPVTPRRDPRYELLGLDSSMMEMVKTENETETCGTKGKPNYEIIGKLGQGAWGAVHKVRTKTGKYWTKYKYFALKVPVDNDPDAAEANVKEANIMGTVHCTHVLPLVEKAPCVAEKGQLSTAFVTKLMPGDLHEWSVQASRSKKKKCIEKIYTDIHNGLECFHKAGYVHGDIKAGNILYGSLDEEGCPKDIVLADFGLTTKVGELNGKYEHKSWMQCYNIPETMFEGVKDPLQLTGNVKLENGDTVPAVTMKPVLDWCSLAFLLRQFVPGAVSEELQRKYGKGACGKMGPGRKWSLP